MIDLQVTFLKVARDAKRGTFRPRVVVFETLSIVTRRAVDPVLASIVRASTRKLFYSLGALTVERRVAPPTALARLR